MRSLLVTTGYPWPADTGGKLRTRCIAEGLAGLGPLDVFVLGGSEPAGGPDDPLPLSRLGWAAPTPQRERPVDLAKWLICSRRPRELSCRDGEQAGSAFGRWVRGRSYDLIWFAGVESLLTLGGEVSGRRILDLWDLEDHKINGELSVRGMHAPQSGGWRRRARRTQLRVNRRRWRRTQTAAVARVDAVAVCSGVDAERLGAEHSFVVPNGYPTPPVPLGRASAGAPPTVSFVGDLTYLPNLDAAHHLALDVAPELRARIDGVQIRLVGRSHSARRLQDPPRVVVTGHVDDLDEELATADVAAVPIRFGGGTRLKVLEAFAHRIPVVSTGIGAEGLGARDGRELLLADTPADFAAACARVLTDDGLRAALADAGQALHQAQFTPHRVATRVAEVVRSVLVDRG